MPWNPACAVWQHANAVKAAVNAGMARMFASFDAGIAQGDLSGTPVYYLALTGVEPQSFEAWVKANAAALSAPATQ